MQNNASVNDSEAVSNDYRERELKQALEHGMNDLDGFFVSLSSISVNLEWMDKCVLFTPTKPTILFVYNFLPSAEIEHIKQNNIHVSYASDIHNISDIENIIANIREKIGNRPYIVSFDFDAISPKYFSDVLVPETGGISVEMANRLIHLLHDAYSFEFVEYSPTGNKDCEKIVHDLIKKEGANIPVVEESEVQNG